MPMVDFLKSHSFVTFQNSLLHSILTNATFPKPKTISFTTYKEQSASILIMTFILVFPQAQESRILLFKARLLPFWYKGIQAQGCILRGFWSDKFFFFNFFIFGCIGSLLLHAGFLQLWRVGATPCCSARASHCGGFSCCRARALGVRASVVVARMLSSCGAVSRAQQLWLTGSVAPWHVGSSQTRARNCVPCIGRRILNHCATREAQSDNFLKIIIP